MSGIFNNIKKFFKSRSFKHGTMSTVFVAIFVCVVVVFNIVASILTDRFYLKLDLTAESVYEVDQEAVDIIKALEEDITITIMSSRDAYEEVEYYRILSEILGKYEAYSNGKIKVQYIDSDINPKYYEKYDAFGSLSYYDIIVESANRYKVLKPMDLYQTKMNYETQETSYIGLQADRQLISAINYALTDELPTAAVITGHGETKVQELENMLAAGNYKVMTVNLLTDNIGADVDLLVLANPMMDFTKEEIDKLEAYFLREGDAIIALSPSCPKLTNLELYLEEWGVRYEEQTVLDYELNMGEPKYVVVDVNMEKNQEGKVLCPINEKFTLTDQSIFIYNARPITRLFTLEGAVATSVALTTSESSFAISSSNDSAISSVTKDQAEAEGPFNVAMFIERYAPEGSGDGYSKVLFCNAGMITDSALTHVSTINEKYIAMVIDHTTPEYDYVAISYKAFSDTSLAILGWQADAIAYTLIGIIPAIILIMGIVVWMRRRHL